MERSTCCLHQTFVSFHPNTSPEHCYWCSEPVPPHSYFSIQSFRRLKVWSIVEESNYCCCTLVLGALFANLLGFVCFPWRVCFCWFVCFCQFLLACLFCQVVCFSWFVVVNVVSYRCKLLLVVVSCWRMLDVLLLSVPFNMCIGCCDNFYKLFQVA